MNKYSNFGFSSILLSFVMICILTFSALSLISANSDYRLSRKIEQNNSAYYTAEKDAYLTLAAIDSALAAAYDTSPDEDSYYKLAAQTIPSVCGQELVRTDSDYTVTYTTPIGDDQTLCISLSIRYPAEEIKTFYEITEWKTTHETSYVEDQPLHLMGKDE